MCYRNSLGSVEFLGTQKVQYTPLKVSTKNLQLLSSLAAYLFYASAHTCMAATIVICDFQERTIVYCAK